MEIFEHENYKTYVRQRLLAMPKKGYGQLQKISQYLGVHTTYVSQVFNGDKTLNEEQGMLIAEFLSLNDIETQYFIKMIQIERSGSEKYRRLLIKDADKIKEQAKRVSTRLAVKKVIPDDQKAIFYSDWYYSAIRLLAGIPGHSDVESIAHRFGLPRQLVSRVTQFLLEAGLLVRDDEMLKVGPSRTHLEPDSPFIKLHHLNWRNKALEHIGHSSDAKLHYSSAMTLSSKDVEIVRQKILKLIEDVSKVVDPSPREELMCLNIDWFNLLPKKSED